MTHSYETPESFAKAFARLHGFAPSKAKSLKRRLKFFHPLNIEISITGGFDMSKRVLEKGERANEIAERNYIDGYHGNYNDWIILDPTHEELEEVLDKLTGEDSNFAIFTNVKPIDNCFYIQTATEMDEDGAGFRYMVEAQFVYGYFEKPTNPDIKQYRTYMKDVGKLKKLFHAFAAGKIPDVSDWNDVTERGKPKWDFQMDAIKVIIDNEPTYKIAYGPTPEDVGEWIEKLSYPGNAFARILAREAVDHCLYIMTQMEPDGEDFKYKIITHFVYEYDEVARRSKYKRYQKYFVDRDEVRQLFVDFLARKRPDITNWEDGPLDENAEVDQSKLQLVLNGARWQLRNPTAVEITEKIKSLSLPDDNYAILQSVKYEDGCKVLVVKLEKDENDGSDIKYGVQAKFEKSRYEKDAKHYRKYFTDLSEVLTLFTDIVTGISPDVTGWADVTAAPNS